MQESVWGECKANDRLPKVYFWSLLSAVARTLRLVFRIALLPSATMNVSVHRCWRGFETS